MNLSVSHPLDSRSPFGTCVPPPPAGGVFPKRGAIDKEISFRSNTRCCDKTSPPQSLPLSGEVARRRRDGEVWPAPPAKASPLWGRWHRAKRRCRRGCTEQHLRYSAHSKGVLCPTSQSRIRSTAVPLSALACHLPRPGESFLVGEPLAKRCRFR